VVANSTMNRERGLSGGNSYSRDLAFDPLAFLKDRLSVARHASWLDLCCGSGRAVIEAGERFRSAGQAEQVTLHGVDLVPLFRPAPEDLACVHFRAASLADWSPEQRYDLITCVHGLHYVGDKIGLVARAVSWLAEEGRFVANLDLENLRLEDGSPAGRAVVRELRARGLVYDARRRLLSGAGGKSARLPFTYLGADDAAGPNYTGQPAVHSYYRYKPFMSDSAP